MHNTTQLLQQLHQQTETMLQKVLAEWQMLPIETLRRKPAPDKWNAAQCMEHLNIYGRHYLPAIEQGIRKAQQCNSQPVTLFKSSWLGAYFTKIMLPQNDGSLKTKMQAPKNAVPSADPDPHLMLAEFIDQLERLLQLLDQAATVNIQQIRIPTSLSRWVTLSLGDTFLFYTAHIQRHFLQAERCNTI